MREPPIPGLRDEGYTFCVHVYTPYIRGYIDVYGGERQLSPVFVYVCTSLPAGGMERRPGGDQEGFDVRTSAGREHRRRRSGNRNRWAEGGIARHPRRRKR